MVRKIHFLIFIHLLSKIIYPQIYPELDWYKIYNGPGNSYDFSHGVVLVDSEIYVAGGSYMPDGYADAFFIKYSKEGDSLFSFFYSLQPNVRDEYNSVAVDENSQIYLTGVTTVGIEKRMIFQKYSSSGENLWTENFNFKARGLKVIMDKNNSPVLAYDNWEGPRYTHLVINKFNSSGDSIWAAVFRSDTTAYSVAGLLIDDENYIYVPIVQLQVKNGESIYYSSVACVKDGVILWHKYLSGSINRGIVFDKEKNIIALTQDSSRIYKIDHSTGEFIWEKNINDSLYQINILTNACVDNQNNIIAAGYNSYFNSDVQIKKLSPSGEVLWMKNYNSPDNLSDLPLGILIDKNDDVYASVGSEDSLGGYPYTSVLKLSKDGDKEWEYFFNVPNYEQSYFSPFFIDDSLNLYLGGSIYNSISASNIFIMKLLQKSGTAVKDPPVVSGSYSLQQNYPNPFNPTTNFGFRIANFGFVSLKLFDIVGREVATLVNEEKSPGYYKVEFDGSRLASGVYFCRLQAGGFTDTKKIILLR
ncbi:MAG TPA: T9SS type A sorting domain-containing protein [Ignavibacteriaceae bacterium]|nr:T9SS type A sorting domain-containing protein [Ignavibacteriaceae bacterium]